MFVGHYAAALAAKAAQPKAPLWTYVLAAQLVDVAWSGLIIAGVERLRFDPSLPGSSLVLEHMPYTHSLPAAVLWAVGAGLLATWALKLPRAAASAPRSPAVLPPPPTARRPAGCGCRACVRGPGCCPAGWDRTAGARPRR